jgi:2-keto-4-pentenoate hydratase/2-oxohepta-3-ene-1,7-dioic acid hydratase in catechol pathway
LSAAGACDTVDVPNRRGKPSIWGCSAIGAPDVEPATAALSHNMKLVSFRAGDEVHAGAVIQDRVLDLSRVLAALPMAGRVAQALPLSSGEMLGLLHAGAEGFAQLARHIESIVRDGSLARHPRLDSVQLLAPVPRPGKIVGVGRNYAEHAKEVGTPAQEQPRLFTKVPSSVVGPGSVIKRPAVVKKMDFEAELAVVIGAVASNVARARALECVAGYTVLNDLSAREFQLDVSPPQTSLAKSMDGFCPMGPWLVTRDEIPDPQALDIACDVNGQPMQRGRTSDMIFPVDRLIEYISGFMTLEPGDVIATGTPAGVGAFRKPPVWLAPGDRIRIEISQIGVLEHSIG